MKDSLGPETTKKIAKLARLKLSEAEVQRFTKDLSSILGYVQKLQEVNTDGVEPLMHGIELHDHLREDKAKPMSEEELKEMLSCSSQVLYEQYKVPQVIGEA